MPQPVSGKPFRVPGARTPGCGAIKDEQKLARLVKENQFQADIFPLSGKPDAGHSICSSEVSLPEGRGYCRANGAGKEHSDKVLCGFYVLPRAAVLKSTALISGRFQLRNCGGLVTVLFQQTAPTIRHRPREYATGDLELRAGYE